MKRLPWKYLAGLIDGEGCIDVQIGSGVYIRPRLRIAMTEPGLEVLKMCQNSYGGYLLKSKPPKNNNWTQAYSWELSGYKQACPVLRNVTKSLFIKKEQARLCLWMETNIKGQQVSTQVRDVIREELRLMKHDPHRLSEKAQDNILEILQSSLTPVK